MFVFKHAEISWMHRRHPFTWMVSVARGEWRCMILHIKLQHPNANVCFATLLFFLFDLQWSINSKANALTGCCREQKRCHQSIIDYVVKFCTIYRCVSLSLHSSPRRTETSKSPISVYLHFIIANTIKTALVLY